MKRFLHIISLAALVVSALACNKEVGPSIYDSSALVTFKPQPDGSYFIRASEEVAYNVLNQGDLKYPFKEKGEKRAIITFSSDFKESSFKPAGAEAYSKVFNITLTRVDEIATRNVSPSVENNAGLYGSDRMDLIIGSSYVLSTFIDDGYLTVFGSIAATDTDKKHDLYLVAGTDPSDPYLLELHHDAHGDTPSAGNLYNVVTCFSLKDLPDTGGETVKLKVVWDSRTDNTRKKAEFDYVSRTDW